jgi:carbon storage regulator
MGLIDALTARSARLPPLGRSGKKFVRRGNRPHCNRQETEGRWDCRCLVRTSSARDAEPCLPWGRGGHRERPRDKIRSLNIIVCKIYNGCSRVMDVFNVKRQRTMLILTRRPTQALTIGNDVTVTILEIRGGQVRIGISAPRDTLVLREEIVEKARAARRQSDAES